MLWRTDQSIWVVRLRTSASEPDDRLGTLLLLATSMAWPPVTTPAHYTYKSLIKPIIYMAVFKYDGIINTSDICCIDYRGKWNQCWYLPLCYTCTFSNINAYIWFTQHLQITDWPLCNLQDYKIYILFTAHNYKYMLIYI